jgi:hypothetical protein
LGSQTIGSDPDYAARNGETHFNWSRNHYVMKWGTDPGSEKFSTPYYRPDREYRRWPDPCDTIEIRDWDNGRRTKGAG